MDGEQVDQIIEELTSDPKKEWKLIIFDTQADHMPSGDEDKSKDFTVIKKAVQRIAQATGAAVGLIHHTGWDDSRERGSSRQRQALDVVMQIKDQRITNVKQKYGRSSSRSCSPSRTRLGLARYSCGRRPRLSS
jgi:hypothetical protein